VKTKKNVRSDSVQINNARKHDFVLIQQRIINDMSQIQGYNYDKIMYDQFFKGGFFHIISEIVY
jgi:hypothetical protein